jgi:hypothetical protein
MSYTPKRLKPAHLQVIRLHWMGKDNTEIAAITGYTPQQVSNVINCEDAQKIIEGLNADAIDTMREVQCELQLSAPLYLNNLHEMAFSCADLRVKANINIALLGMAGHVPIKRVVVQDQTVLQKQYEGMSEEDIVADIRGELAPGKAPDGSVLQ